MYSEAENTHGRAYVPILTCSSRRVASRACGASHVFESDLEIAKREYDKCDRDQAKVPQHYTASNADDNKVRDRLWQLVENEVARLVREKERYLALAKEIDGRIADRQQSTFQLERLVEYCARAAQNLDSFWFEEKRMAFQALQIRITANGGDWDVDGSIPIPLDEGDDVPEFQTLSAGTVYDRRAGLMDSWRGG